MSAPRAFSFVPPDFGVTSRGGTVSERPNYTGMTVIDSWHAPA